MGLLGKLFRKNQAAEEKIYAPMAGRTVSITDVPDPVFAEKMVGDGVAIIPSAGRVCAPCNGRVETMFDTGHAISMVSDFGAELLIHVGLETVTLEGRPFRIHVQSGDRVKKGQLLMEVDLEAVRTAGLNAITPVVICNCDKFTSVHALTEVEVTGEDIIIELIK